MNIVLIFFLSFRCNKLSSCHILVNSAVLPPVCPETQKYLEAQYQCEPNIVIAEKVRKTRLPRFQGYISDVWSNRNKGLDIHNVEAAIEKVIANHDIPITEETSSSFISGESKNRNANSKIINNFHASRINSFVNNKKEFRNLSTSRWQNKNTTTLPLLLTKSSLSDNSSVDDDEVHWTSKELLIIILSSSLSVILIITTAAMVIIKVQFLLLS